MSRMGNPFWSQLLERWKQILSEIPKNLSCNYGNIGKIPLISQQFPPYKNIPISYIIDEKYAVLPPSHLKQRIPEINWNAVSLNMLNIATRNIRTRCRRLATFNGNYLPAADPILLSSKKGCKELADTHFPKSFNSKHWGTLRKFNENYNIPEELIGKQISKLARTSKIPEAKDLQYRICLLYTSPSPRD